MHVFLVQASNMSIALANAANVTDPALLSTMNMSSADAVLATLHVPVVNQTTMNIVDMCVTSTGPGANAITAAPCRQASLAQLFVYNTKSNAVYAATDLMSCAFANANATTASTPAVAPLGGTANIIMVERDMATPCNATSKAIMFTPANAQQAVVTVTPSQPSSVPGTVASTATGTVAGAGGPSMDYAAGDHDPAAMYEGTALQGN